MNTSRHSLLKIQTGSAHRSPSVQSQNSKKSSLPQRGTGSAELATIVARMTGKMADFALGPILLLKTAMQVLLARRASISSKVLTAVEIGYAGQSHSVLPTSSNLRRLRQSVTATARKSLLAGMTNTKSSLQPKHRIVHARGASLACMMNLRPPTAQLQRIEYAGSSLFVRRTNLSQLGRLPPKTEFVKISKLVMLSSMRVNLQQPPQTETAPF
mmetsp:Transcript_95923/g.170258  ORF Transcript_95923/g.170258 Transcript_95923/m.170258 type:complete len:214 (+) Transcript_95923:1723-2364(+)